MEHKLLSLLGIARRANRLSLGHDCAVEAVQKGQATLLLFAQDASERLEQEFDRELKRAKTDCPTLRLRFSMEETGRAIGKKAAVIAVTDEGFAKALMKLDATDTKEDDGV